MSQDQRHKELDDAGHAPHAASPGHPEPGKQTLTERATKDAAGDEVEVKRLKREVRDLYVGDGRYQEQGILHHKITAVHEITGYLSHRNETVGPGPLHSAIELGVEAAAGALAVAAGSSLLLGALVAGGTATSLKLLSKFGGAKAPPLKPEKFGSDYETALRENWPRSVNNLLVQMSTLEAARETHRQVLSTHENTNAIKKNQMNELLDAWVNALKLKTQKGTRSVASMGTENFGDSTAGRLHIEGILIDSIDRDPPVVHALHLRAKLTGVPQDARDVMFDRKVGDIRVARTIEGTCRIPPSNHGGAAPPHFVFGVMPGESNTIQQRPKETDERAKQQLANLEGARIWEGGIGIIWDMIKDQTLQSLGVKSVEN